MSKRKADPTTGQSETTSGDNVQTASESATRSALAAAMSEGGEAPEESLRQDDQEGAEQEPEDGDGDPGEDVDEPEGEDPEGDEDDAEEEPEDEGEDAEEEAEEGEDDGLSDLSKSEAIAMVRRQKKGVDKLKARSEQLAKELDEANERAEANQQASEVMSQWSEAVEDPERAPLALGRLIAHVAKTHNLQVDEIVAKVQSVAKNGTVIEMPDFEALAREAADEVEFEYEDEKERWIKATVAMERLKYKREQASNPKPSATQTEKPDDRAQLSAKFKKEFDETVLTLKEDYPSFKLTEEMARQAVGKFPKLSVEDAVFRMWHKKMTEVSVTKARKDVENRPPRMVQHTGKAGKGRPMPSNPAKMTRAEMARAMTGQN